MVSVMLVSRLCEYTRSKAVCFRMFSTIRHAPLAVSLSPAREERKDTLISAHTLTAKVRDSSIVVHSIIFIRSFICRLRL